MSNANTPKFTITFTWRLAYQFTPILNLGPADRQARFQKVDLVDPYDQLERPDSIRVLAECITPGNDPANGSGFPQVGPPLAHKDTLNIIGQPDLRAWLAFKRSGDFFR